MLYVVLEYWRWLALAAAIGLLVTVVIVQGERRTPAHATAPLLALFILAALLLAVIAPPFAGRAALYHEAALLMFAAYLLGGIVGLVFGRALPFTYKAWWVGLAVVAFVWVEANVLVNPGIESDLGARVSDAATPTGDTQLKLDVDDRDGFLLANEKSRAAPSGTIALQPTTEDAAKNVHEKNEVDSALTKIAGKVAEAKAKRAAAVTAEAEMAEVRDALRAIAAKVEAAKAARTNPVSSSPATGLAQR
jgi:hypothetical protein